MAILNEENIGQLAIGVADGLFELSSAENTTLKVLGRGNGLSLAFSVGIAVTKTESENGDGFDYAFSIGGEVIALAANIALAAQLQPILIAALSSAKFLAFIPGGAALIGAGLIAGGTVIFATSVLGDAVDIIADLSVPDTSIQIKDGVGNDVIEYVVDGPISAAGYADEASFISAYIETLPPEQQSQVNGFSFEFTRPFEDDQVFTVSNGDIIQDVANTLNSGIDDFFLSQSDVANNGQQPFTGFFTTGADTLTNQVLFDEINGENYIFTRPDDVLSIDVDGNILTPRVNFSPDAFVKGDGGLFGDSQNNIVSGGDGNDELSGGAGDDLLLGGDGDDTLRGDAGADSLWGGNGADTYIAGADNDFVGDYSFAEGDILRFAGIDDVTDLAFARTGGGGDLTVALGASSFSLNEYLSFGGSQFDLRIQTDSGVFEVVLNPDLSIAAIKQVATEGDDTLDGTSGNDDLSGLGGMDDINGFDGRDVLNGGADNDTLTGGADQDRFIFADGDGDDTVTDYTLTDADVIVLNDVADTGGITTTRVDVNGNADDAGSDLQIGHGPGDTIQLNGFFDNQDGPIRTVLVEFAGTDAPMAVTIDDMGAVLNPDTIEDLAPETIDAPTADDFIGTPNADLLEGNNNDNNMSGLADNDLIRGLDGNDTIDAGAGNDTVEGGAGNDTIDGGDGNDNLMGGDGNDAITGGAGADTITGDVGNDQLFGGSGNDIISASAGQNIAFGGLGDDTITFGSILNPLTESQQAFGGEGADFIAGADGNDLLDGGAGDDEIRGGLGNDTINGGTGNDTVQGGAGNDFITTGDGNDRVEDQSLDPEDNNADVIFTGAGMDTVQLSSGTGHLIDTGADDDTVILAGNASGTVLGGAGNDSLTGNNNQFGVYDGGTGNDTINAQGLLIGGEGDDTIFTKSTGNIVEGGNGNDQIFDGGVGSVLNGGNGDDLMTFTASAVTVEGGADNDFIGTNVTGNSTAIVDGGTGDDEIVVRGLRGLSLYGGDGNDTIEGGREQFVSGGQGNDAITVSVDTMAFGDDGDDILIGAEALDFTGELHGGAGNDTLLGSVNIIGNNIFFGDDGDDILNAKAGQDILTGGTGADLFVRESGGNNDTVTDYSFVEGDVVNYTSSLTDVSSLITMRTGDDLIINDNEAVIIGDVVITSSEVVLQGFFSAFTFPAEVSVSFAPDGSNPIVLLFDEAGKIVDENTLGTNADDQLIGTQGDDVLAGLDGDDAIFGLAGNDELDGGAGNDTLTGGAGDDLLIGNEGDDIVDAGDGDDTIIAGSGQGNDAYDGGLGNDTIVYSSSSQGVNVNLLLGTGEGIEVDSDTIINVENVIAGQGDDVIVSGLADNILNGQSGADRYVMDMVSDDTIIDMAADGAVDTIVFTSSAIDTSSLFFQVDGDNMTILSDGQNGSVTVQGWFANVNNQIEQVELSDGTIITATEINDAITSNGGRLVDTPPENTAPDAVADTFDAMDADSVSGNVLQNDMDADGDVLTVQAGTFVTVNGGTVDLLANGDFTYTATEGYRGADSFSYSVDDGRGGTDTAEVTIANIFTNADPDAVNDAFDANDEAAFAGNVLQNDVDADGDALTVTPAVITTVNGGMVELLADGSFTYTAAEGFSGADTFDYTITDEFGAMDTATVTLSNINAVVEVDVAPEITPENVMVSADIEAVVDPYDFVPEPQEFPDLVERARLDSDLVNGANRQNLTFNDDRNVKINFVEEGAGYKNTLGMYTVEADGTLSNVQILAENLSGTGQGVYGGGSFNAGDMLADLDVAAGTEIGFFIVADGYMKNNQYNKTDFDNGTLEFRVQNKNGDTASIDDGKTVLYFTDENGKDIKINGDIWHASSTSLNKDGEVHSVTGDLEDGKLIIGFEDLKNLGDADFNDVVIELEVSPTVDFMLDDVAIATDIVISDDDDMTLTEATIELKAGEEMGDLLTIDESLLANTNISFSQVTDTSIVLTGAEDVGAYQDIIQSLTFNNVMENPISGLRQIDITVTDADGLSDSTMISVDIGLDADQNLVAIDPVDVITEYDVDPLANLLELNTPDAEPYAANHDTAYIETRVEMVEDLIPQTVSEFG